jgi:uncharacterized protein
MEIVPHRRRSGRAEQRASLTPARVSGVAAENAAAGLQIDVSTKSRPLRIGLLSDTHGLLRPEALDALHGSHRIVHAGDIGDATILETLATLAPVTAVRGNNDRGAWADALQEWEVLSIGEVRIGVVHDRADLARFHRNDVQAVISGHSHVPRIEERDGMLFVNPGSAGPRRFSLPVSVGEIVVEGATLRARLIMLTVAAPARKR